MTADDQIDEAEREALSAPSVGTERLIPPNPPDEAPTESAELLPEPVAGVANPASGSPDETTELESGAETDTGAVDSEPAILAGIASTPTPPVTARREWTFRRWQVVAAAIVVALLAVAIGAASQQSKINDLEDKNSALTDRNAHVISERNAAQKKFDDRAAQVAADKAKAERIAAEQKAAADKAAADQKAAADKAAADQKAAADKAAADAAAAEARKNTISSGVYEIGVDKNPGRYKTEGPAGTNPVGCYYAVLNSTNTSDIANNNITQGPATIDLAAGQFFESSSCQVWQRVG